MSRYNGKSCRLILMIVMTAGFFLVELVVGYITHSLALVGDSYHMLSDVISLLVGFASVRIARWSSKNNTYGWVRAEILGAMVNSVFLIALCFTIAVEALQRMVETDEIKDPKLLLIVGCVGLAINLVGLALFGSHGHSHGGGGHGHSHGGGDHGHSHGAKAGGQSHDQAVECERKLANSKPSNGAISSDGLSESEIDEVIDLEKIAPKIATSAQLNMRGVFLHILGDALGSVVVVISALVIMFCEGDWKYKLDPAMSLLMVMLIMSSTIPLFKESALILLQTVPTHLRIHDIKKKLLQVEGVLEVHELHVWQLAGDRIIASAHVRCQNLSEYTRLADLVKKFFHDQGIHSTTIQPEFNELEQHSKVGQDCGVECPDTKVCLPQTCCGKKIEKQEAKRLKDIVVDESITQNNNSNVYP